MKKLLLSAVSILALTIFVLSSQTSCKKETITNTVTDTVYQCTTTINGLWVGTYSVTSLPAQGQLFYSLIVYPDGSLLYKAKGGDGNFYYAKGTWTLSGNTFAGTVVSFNTPAVTQTVTATYSATAGTLTNGTWADVANSGNLQSMTKIK